jgi:hypothetical protein
MERRRRGPRQMLDYFEETNEYSKFKEKETCSIYDSTNA